MTLWNSTEELFEKVHAISVTQELLTHSHVGYFSSDRTSHWPQV